MGKNLFKEFKEEVDKAVQEVMRELSEKVLLLDIDGVVCEGQQPISPEMRAVLRQVSNLYYVTGNSYTKAIDMTAGIRIFSNCGDDLRVHGQLIWEDKETPPLPMYNDPDRLGIEAVLKNHLNRNNITAPNCIEWRSPRFVNFSHVGRYATQKERENHDSSWREGLRDYLYTMFSEDNIEVAIGGKISLDIYSKGADKSRAARYINEVLKKPFLFIGDKTSPGGNDYPIVKYCEESTYKNKVLTTSGPSETIELIDRYWNE